MKDDFEVGELELPLRPEVDLPRQAHVRGFDRRGVLLKRGETFSIKTQYMFSLKCIRH